MSDFGEGLVYGERFAQVPTTVVYAEVSPMAKVLWMIYDLHAGPEGRSYPGGKRMAELLKCSENTIRRAKAELVEAGLIEVRPRFTEEGRRSSDDVFLVGRPTKDGRVPPTKDGRGSITSSERYKRSLAPPSQNRPQPNQSGPSEEDNGWRPERRIHVATETELEPFDLRDAVRTYRKGRDPDA